MLKNIDDFVIHYLVEGTKIHNTIAAHTFALCITHDRKFFKKIFYNIFSYLYKRKDNRAFGYLYMLYSECSENLNKPITLPFVRIHYGISVCLYSVKNDKGFIIYQSKIIINPSLFMKSFDPIFNPESYDYTLTIPRDNKFWINFGPKLKEFLRQWDILNESKTFSIYLVRIDMCADISVPDDFPISTYIGYIHRVIKSFTYDDEDFPIDQYMHQSTTYNKSQAFTIYEKMYEQKVHHHNYYDDGSHLLRLEYKLFPRKIRHILSKVSEDSEMEIYQEVSTKRSLDDILYTIGNLVVLSPIIILYGINLIFPKGSFLLEKDAKRLVKDYVKRKQTRYGMYEIISKLSLYKDYTDVVAVSKRIRESFSPPKYNRLLRRMETLGIAPLYLDKKDSDIGSLPSLHDLFLSALFQTESESEYMQMLLS